MKKAMVFVALIYLTACGMTGDLDSMNQKMDSVSTSAKQMSQSLNETQKNTDAMVQYMGEAITGFKALVESASGVMEGLPQVGTQTTTGEVQDLPATPKLGPILDLSSKTPEELSALETELEHAAQIKSILEGTIPNILGLIESFQVTPSTDPAKAQSINHISQLLEQL